MPKGCVESLPAGTYWVESVDDIQGGVLLPDAFRNLAVLHKYSNADDSGSDQTLLVKWNEIDEALMRDKMCDPLPPERTTTPTISAGHFN